MRNEPMLDSTASWVQFSSFMTILHNDVSVVENRTASTQLLNNSWLPRAKPISALMASTNMALQEKRRLMKESFKESRINCLDEIDSTPKNNDSLPDNHFPLSPDSPLKSSYDEIVLSTTSLNHKPVAEFGSTREFGNILPNSPDTSSDDETVPDGITQQKRKNNMPIARRKNEDKDRTKCVKNFDKLKVFKVPATEVINKNDNKSKKKEGLPHTGAGDTTYSNDFSVLLSKNDSQNRIGKPSDNNSKIQDAGKKSKMAHKPQNVKDNITIEKWFMRKMSNMRIQIQGIITHGEFSGNLWRSSAIVKRINNRTVQTKSGSSYTLRGPLMKDFALEEGFLSTTVKAFQNGFPANWMAILERDADRSPIENKDFSSRHQTKDKPHPLLNDSDIFGIKLKPRSKPKANVKDGDDVGAVKPKNKLKANVKDDGAVALKPKDKPKANVKNGDSVIAVKPSNKHKVDKKDGDDVIAVKSSIKRKSNVKNDADLIALKPSNKRKANVKNGDDVIALKPSNKRKVNVKDGDNVTAVQPNNKRKVDVKDGGDVIARPTQSKKPKTAKSSIEKQADNNVVEDDILVENLPRSSRGRKKIPRLRWWANERVNTTISYVMQADNSDLTISKPSLLDGEVEVSGAVPQSKEKNQKKVPKSTGDKKVKKPESKNVKDLPESKPKSKISKKKTASKNVKDLPESEPKSKISKKKTASKKLSAAKAKAEETDKCDKENDNILAAITAKKGSKKYKTQIRQLIDNHNKDYEDDMFENMNTKTNANLLSEMLECDDDPYNVAGFATPVINPTLMSMRPETEYITPATHSGITPSLLKSLNRSDMDSYHHQRQKWKKNASIQKKPSPRKKGKAKPAEPDAALSTGVFDVFPVEKNYDEEAEGPADYYFDEN